MSASQLPAVAGLDGGTVADCEHSSGKDVNWGRRLLHGAAWSVIGTGLSYAASLVVLTVTGRILGVAAFGEFGMLNSTTGVFGVFAGLGLGLTGTKYVAEFKVSDPQRAGRIIGITVALSVITGCLAGLVLVVAAGPVARYGLNSVHLATDLRLSWLMLVFGALNTTQSGVLAGFEDFAGLARCNLLRWLFGIPINLAMVYLWGVRGAILGTAAVYLIGCIVNQKRIRYLCSGAGIQVKIAGFRTELPMLWRFSFPALLASLVGVPIQWVVSAIVVHQPQGYVQLGLLTAANSWKALVTFLPITVSSAALPALTSLHVRAREDDEVSGGVELANAMNQLALWPVAIMTMLLAGPVMRFYGKDFTAGRTIFAVMIGGTAIGYVGGTMGTLITSRGRMWFGVAQNILFGSFLLALTLARVSTSGALAVAQGTAVAYLVLLTGTAVYMQRTHLISSSMAVRMAAGGVLMAACTALAPNVPSRAALWLVFPAGVVALGFALLLVSSKSRRVLFQVINGSLGRQFAPVI